jgi:hypothetical protein
MPVLLVRKRAGIRVPAPWIGWWQLAIDGPPSMESIMKSSKAISSVIVGLIAAVALVWAGCASSEAGTRKGVKHHSAEAQTTAKPVKMRYFGGPKSPMYPG